MRRLTPWLRVGVLLLCGAVVVAAKGQTRRLVVTGGTLQASIEITSPDALANVWGGSFLGEPTAEPSRTLPRYTVSFYVVPPREAAERLMYVVSYVRDPDGAGGVVCLPGRGEPTYRAERHHDPETRPGRPMPPRRNALEPGNQRRSALSATPRSRPART